MPIATVKLGSQGFESSAIGLGCMGMSAAYKTAGETTSDEQIKAVFDRCAELGVTLLNSAEFYGADRANERAIGANIAGRTDKFQVTLKFGGVGDLDSGMKLDSSPARVCEACDTALQLLGVPAIDVFIQARPDPANPLADVMNCLKGLVASGKVKYVGLSEVTPDEIRAAHAIHPLTCVEQEWSLWSRDIEAGIVPVCRELGIGVLAYSPLGRGFLTGALDVTKLPPGDFRVFGQPRLQGENLGLNLALVEHVKAIATAKGVEPGQVALAWLYQQAATLGVHMIPIPGTKRVKYLEQNVAALDVKLSTDEMEKLNAVFHPDAAQGARYAHAFLMFNGRVSGFSARTRL